LLRHALPLLLVVTQLVPERASVAPSERSHAAVFSKSPPSRMMAMVRSLSMRHSWMMSVPMVELAALRITESPGLRLPWSSSSRYATHISRIMAAYSMGIRSTGILSRSFSFHTTSERHVPSPNLKGNTQSFSLRFFTPGPTLTTTPTPSLPAMNGGLEMVSS
jgi:hypothetical protein